MKITTLMIALLCLFASIPSSSQELNKFAQRIIVGTSLTYIGERNRDIPNQYNEFTWNKNIAVNVGKNFYLGISHQNIYTKGSLVTDEFPRNNYNIAGVFTQFDFTPKDKNRLFAELSWNYGNYCTCDDGDPYKRGGLNYIGLGGGYDHPINDFLSLDFSFVVYKILGEVPEKYAFTQYVIGLNFDIIRD